MRSEFESLCLSRGLFAAKAHMEAGERDAQAILATARKALRDVTIGLCGIGGTRNPLRQLSAWSVL